MAKLVDAPDFDSGDESLGGSSPSSVATIIMEVYMIDDKPVIVTDPKKIKEIKEALQSSMVYTEDIAPATPSPLPENAAEMWFGKKK